MAAWLFTVPAVTPSSAATWASGRSWWYRSTTTARCLGGRWASAIRSAWRLSTPASSSGPAVSRQLRGRHLTAPPPPPPGRPGVDHDLADVRLRVVTQHPGPARVGPGQCGLQQVLRQRPVSGERVAEPLQRLAAACHEILEHPAPALAIPGWIPASPPMTTLALGNVAAGTRVITGTGRLRQPYAPPAVWEPSSRRYPLRVEVRSLGYRTDLMVRLLEGSLVEDRGDYLVVRSPHNPTYWVGQLPAAGCTSGAEAMPRPGWRCSPPSSRTQAHVRHRY